MKVLHSFSTSHLYWIVAVVATIPRFLFVFLAPEASGGDVAVYLRVAENILTGCGVSNSIPGSGECIPHFGGNQGPGYPLFIATVWWISGHSDLAVRIAQAVIYVASLVYLVDAIRRYTSSSKLALLSGLVLAISPLQVAWPRYILTETLAVAGALWLFAELLKSLHESKLRVIPIALALIVTTFIRLDGILLVVPVAATGFIIHRPLDAIRRGLAIALILGLPWGGWTVRNINVGLTSIMPQSWVDRNPSSSGYLKWVNTWVTNHYQVASVMFPLHGNKYDSIRIDDHAFSFGKARAHVLLEELKEYTGEPFPKHIDEQFAILAVESAEKEPFKIYLLNPSRRLWALWLNVYDSFAWPVGLGGKISNQDRLDIVNAGLWSKLILVKKYPAQMLGKIFITGWRLVLYFLFIFSIWIVCKDEKSRFRDFMVLTLSFIMARSIFSVTLNYIDTRYTLMLMPILELLVVLVVVEFLIARKSNEPSV